MGNYSYNTPSGMTLSQFYDLVDELAQVAGITLDSSTFSESGGQFHFVQVPDLTTPQQNAIQNALNAWVYVDYVALSQAAKPDAQTVIANMGALYPPSAARYLSLTPSEKADVLTTLTTGWSTATAAQKADALRDTLSLIVVAIYFIYLKFINGNEA